VATRPRSGLLRADDPAEATFASGLVFLAFEQGLASGANKTGEGTSVDRSPRVQNDFDRWSVAVRMPKTPSHFPSVFHFGADCFGSCPFPWSFGGASFGLWGLPPFAMTVLLDWKPRM